MRVPVISVTDLYHPHQDPGDNFDLIAAFALPEIDLRGVVLDCTEPFRQPVALPLPHPALWPDDTGPRDPGIVPVMQLNYIFDRDVPFGVGPFRQMRTPEDAITDAPRFQQRGIELILETVERSAAPVHIMSFGSARTIAAAYNRAPELFARNGTVVELSAGASSNTFMEWNTALDPNAIIRLLKSDLLVNVYPDATADGPFSLDTHNTYYSLPNLNFIKDMAPALRRYLQFAFGRSSRMDFLRALDVESSSPEADTVFKHKHKVWETALWQQVSGRLLARKPGEPWRLAPQSEVDESWEILPQALLPCDVAVADDGRYAFELTEAESDTTKRIYFRPNPAEQEAALREALPGLYLSFAP